MKSNKILFVTHRASNCGIYEYGKEVFEAISKSEKFDFIHIECSSFIALIFALLRHRPSTVIYNYNQSVMPWLRFPIIPTKAYLNLSFLIPIPQIGIIHEVTDEIAMAARPRQWFVVGAHKLVNSIFDGYIVPDPTYLGTNPLVHKVGRIVPSFSKEVPNPIIPTFGSFGFATPNKGFELIIDLVCKEYDEAVIRINMPPSTFGDPNGDNARMIAENCLQRCTKSGIRIEISHDFLDSTGVLEFLSGNTANIFLYTNPKSDARGISSVIEKAMAVGKPICISDSRMFRHVSDISPSIVVNSRPLRQITDSGFPSELAVRRGIWSAEHMLIDYERICESIINGQ